MSSAGAAGLLLIDKPSGPTSHDIVDAVRRALAQRRVGHAGTLDPLASGLLPLLVGRATRLVRFLPSSPKEYEGTLQLGLSTVTDDVTGEVLDRHAGDLPEPGRVVAEARALEGRLLQVPPAISARKVAGDRLYRLTRAGVAAEAPPSEVEVSRFELAAADRPGLYRFRARVSAGTYIRALARDLGARLGCGGALASLRRTAIGPMHPSPALQLEPDLSVDPGVLHGELIPPERMPLEPAALRLGREEAERFRQGAAVIGIREVGLRAVHAPDGRLLGVGDCTEGVLRPRVVLAGDG